MILHDNLEKFRWIFANAFRKYLYGNEERYYAKSGIILMKHELDSGHVAIYQTSSDESILGLLLQSCIYKHGYEEVFEALAAKCILTEDTKALLRNNKNLSYSSIVKDYLKIFGIELDEEDEPYSEDYEEVEDYEDYEEDEEF